MELVLIRHGVTAWNQQRRFQGQIDTPLSDEGHQQAMLTARHLSALSEEQPIQAIYASDLKRAWSTAEPIARLLGLPILKQSLLRERHYGVFEGKTHDELQQLAVRLFSLEHPAHTFDGRPIFIEFSAAFIYDTFQNKKQRT